MTAPLAAEAPALLTGLLPGLQTLAFTRLAVSLECAGHLPEQTLLPSDPTVPSPHTQAKPLG